MSSTTFVDYSTPIVASWLNDVNTTVYTALGNGSTPAQVRTNIGAAVAGPIASSGITGAAVAGPIGSSGITGAAASGTNTDITSLASPALTSATATTQSVGDNSTKVATTAFVQAATVTTANDATFADSSTKAASTGWVRGAMSAIMVALGFLFTNSYIKFPSCLGGFVAQWGSWNSSAGGDAAISFPISFPTAFYGIVGSTTSGGVSDPTIFSTGPSTLLSSIPASIWNLSGARVVRSAYWFAWGK